jgi:hypothetical protein
VLPFPPCLTAGQENRRQHFLYEVHPILTHRDLRVEFVGSRRLAEYTPVAIHDNVVHRREAVAVSYLWRNRVRMGAEYWHATYNIHSPDISLGSPRFETAADGGNIWVRPILYQSDRLTFDAGFRTELFGYDGRAASIALPIVTAGFFVPDRYERYAGTAHLSWDPHPKLHWELDGSLGPQRVTGFALLAPPPAEFGLAGSFGTELTLRLGHWRPFMAYNFFSTATAAFPGASDGAYRSHGFTAGLSYRF